MGVGSSDQPGLTAVCNIRLFFAQFFAARRLKLDGLARAHDHAQLTVFHPAHRFNDLFLRLGQMKRCLVRFHGGHLPFAACRRVGAKKPRGRTDPARKKTQ